MKHPFQCLLICPSQDCSGSGCLLAAAASYIYTFSLDNQVLLSTWPQREDQPNDISDGLNGNQDEGSTKRSPAFDPDKEPQELVGKKRKISHPIDSPENYTVKEKSLKGFQKPTTPGEPDVIRLISTTSGRHVVAVSGQDKCIRVFELQSSGVLKLLSERCMTKRPSAILITSNDERILCADKFGDVYSFPLLFTQSKGVSTDALSLGEEELNAPKKAFVPAATHLTVHTARNQRTLQEQLKRTNQVSEKTGLTFEHQLLLGHVSMLTDIAQVSLEGLDAPQGKRRSYIITSDRDEHIRVSRGQPQAYLIENYCLGHTDFVSKICVPSWRPRTLISGGGDDYLMVWDWVLGRVLQKVNLTAEVQSVHPTNSGKETPFDDSSPVLNLTEQTLGGNAKSLPHTEDRRNSSHRLDGLQIAVSGIWAVPHSDNCGQNEESRAGAQAGEVLVACESVPAIFCFDHSAEGALTFRQTLSLAGNPLDVAMCKATRSINVAIDNVHKPGTTRILRNNQGNAFMQRFVKLSQAESRSWVKDDRSVSAINLQGSFEMTDQQMKVLPDLLYGIRNLRKRGKEEDSVS
ncbi:MAG: tRNA (guanine-N(7)-)-methyltransferase non-catalytic subunit trm82 [Candelina mexicana]|nr:MAG: tRNA (guanine-N(7)-)-methyltransferase non-catalytic subunit trm82 [Candelina mexicana]